MCSKVNADSNDCALLCQKRRGQRTNCATPDDLVDSAARKRAETVRKGAKGSSKRRRPHRQETTAPRSHLGNFATASWTSPLGRAHQGRPFSSSRAPNHFESLSLAWSFPRRDYGRPQRARAHLAVRLNLPRPWLVVTLPRSLCKDFRRPHVLGQCGTNSYRSRCQHSRSTSRLSQSYRNVRLSPLTAKVKCAQRPCNTMPDTLKRVTPDTVESTHT